MGYDAPNYQDVRFDEKGNPFWPTASGKRMYIPPLVAAQDSDPRLKAWAQQQGTSITDGKVTDTSRPGASLTKNAGTWDSANGGWDRGFNWDNAAIGGIGALLTGGIANAAMAGGGGAAGASGAVAGGTLPNAGGALIPALTTTVPQVGAGAAGAGMGIGSAIKTGLGLLGDGLDIVGRVGNVATGAASGAADQRLREQLAELQRQQLLQGAARDQFDAGLRGAQFSSDERGKADKRGMLSALLSNLEDVNISGMNPAIAARMPTITGGLRPSALTGGGKREQLMAMLGAAGPSAPTYTPPPALPVSAGASGGERALGAAGLFGNLLGAFKRQPAEERIR